MLVWLFFVSQWFKAFFVGGFLEDRAPGFVSRGFSKNNPWLVIVSPKPPNNSWCFWPSKYGLNWLINGGEQKTAYKSWDGPPGGWGIAFHVFFCWGSQKIWVCVCVCVLAIGLGCGNCLWIFWNGSGFVVILTCLCFRRNSTGCFSPPKHGRLCMLGWWFQAFLDFLAREKSFHLTNYFFVIESHGSVKKDAYKLFTIV